MTQALALALAQSMTLERVAEYFGLVSLILLVLTVPSFIISVFIYENHHAVRYARRHKDSGYWWSLMTWRRYNLIAALGMGTLLAIYFIRVFAHYEVVVEDLPPQPAWSYFASMVSIAILVVVLWLPSYFLLVIKYAIRHDQRIRRLSSEENNEVHQEQHRDA